jgi:uncharacterized membrane protein YbhN (UPF0104 family)
LLLGAACCGQLARSLAVDSLHLSACGVLDAYHRLQFPSSALFSALVGLNTSTFVLITNLRASIVVLVLAGIGQLIPVFAIALLASELGAQIPPVDITIITFGAMLAAAVPVSVAGWGIREGALVYLFGMYGVPPQTAFAISILFGVSLIVASTPCVLVLLAGHPAPPDDIEAS